MMKKKWWQFKVISCAHSKTENLLLNIPSKFLILGELSPPEKNLPATQQRHQFRVFLILIYVSKANEHLISSLQTKGYNPTTEASSISNPSYEVTAIRAYSQPGAAYYYPNLLPCEFTVAPSQSVTVVRCIINLLVWINEYCELSIIKFGQFTS